MINIVNTTVFPILCTIFLAGFCGWMIKTWVEIYRQLINEMHRKTDDSISAHNKMSDAHKLQHEHLNRIEEKINTLIKEN